MATPNMARPRHGRVVAGVAAWAGARLGVNAVAVRAALVALTFAGGIGVALYVLGWLLIPDEGGEDSGETPSAASDRRPQDGRQVAAVGMVVLGVLLLLRESGAWFDDGVVWPVVVAAMGLFVIWRQAERRPHALARLTGARDVRSAARVAGGVALVAAGVGLFLAANQALDAARQGLLATTAVVSGLALTFAPWWARLGRELASERSERIRSQERAELAAHVHDSVLQTLALIQRSADDPRTVASLARRQERDLRAWLFSTAAVPTEATLAQALRSVAEESEDRHGLTVETVLVGDLALDDRLTAIVSATREALTNAARHSGVSEVSLFAEVEGDRVTVFVRDKGCGFDPAAVAADSAGIAESIVGRMERRGGVGTVRSTPGQGTEVELALPRIGIGGWSSSAWVRPRNQVGQ